MSSASFAVHLEVLVTQRAPSGEVESLPRSRWAFFDNLQDSPRRIGYAVAAAYTDLPLPVLVDGMSDVERWHTPAPSNPKEHVASKRTPP
ncbi:hypothetical protein ACFH04_09335 [Streptomyces noboritoensis]|uniref:Uncharacterized protein n=1 Tax=Streptomyces noboritoensis TaxID=67337 RepID=A0ABV6THF1_9ACTN